MESRGRGGNGRGGGGGGGRSGSGGGWRGGRGHNPDYQPGGRGRGQQSERGGYAPPAAWHQQQPQAAPQQDDAGWHQVQRPGRGGRGWDGRGQGQRDSGSGYHAAQGRGGGGSGGGGRGYYGGGRGGGGPAGAVAGPSSQIVPRNLPAYDPALEAKFSKLKLIPAEEPDIPGRLLPIPRPDAGGKAGTRTVTLSVNHFRLRFTCSYSLWHYDISKTSPSSSEMLPISNTELSLIKHRLFNDNAVALAFDGGRALFSPVELRETTADVVIRGVKYRVRLQSGKPHDIGAEELVVSREVLQALDVVMRQNSARNAIRLGRGLYFKEPEIKIDFGAVALRGFEQSVKETENGLVVCVDHSVMPFTKAVNVIDFICNRFRLNLSETPSFPAHLKDQIFRLLKDFRVNVTHRVTKQKFKIFGLTDEPAERITFVDDTTNTRRKLVDYYQEAYQKRVAFRKLPCLSLSDKKTNYVPMEFCVLAEWVLFPKEKLGQADRRLRDESVPPVDHRYQRIRELMNKEDGPSRGDILDKFHVEVHEEMVRTTGRVLDRPMLKLCDAKHREFNLQISQPNCQWNLVNYKVLKGANVDRWAVLDFLGRPSENNEDFIIRLCRRCQDMGINMSDRPLFHMQYGMDTLRESGKLRTILQDCKDKSNGSLQLLICPMFERHDGYKTLKLISETEIGITTQCCLYSVKFKNKGLDQYFANLGLKINAKLGGSNFELSERPPPMNSSSRVMFIGADVNHPKSHDADSPSVVAVVASMNWPASTIYSPIVRTQQHRKENIIDIGKICSELVTRFARANKGRPERIIYFRDGVSDSQFDMVLNEELKDIKNEFDSEGYKPKITVVVAQKRHQTRLFNLDPKGVASNVPAGTVVDRGITAPSNFNFFLCSHTGILGTSKPTHYYVLWDEHGYGSDGMQQLIYSLCFTFARCTKPVSLVTPVYYADLLAYRGRIHLEGMDRKKGQVPLTLPALHPNIDKDGMFFI